MTYIKKYLGTPRDPGKNAFAVTPSDSTELTVGRAIWVGTGGDLAVQMANDEDADTVIFKNVSDGVLLPFEVRKVLSTGTTASDIVVVY